MSQHTITLHGRRGEEWEAVLGTRTLPVLEPRVRSLPLEHVGWKQCWMLDFNALGSAQQLAVVKHLAEKFGSPLVEVMHDATTRGVPITDGPDVELNTPAEPEASQAIDMRMIL